MNQEPHKIFWPNLFLIAGVFFLLSSCARTKLPANAGAAAKSPDAAADTTLGALPKKGEAAAQKQLKEIEEEDETLQALREYRTREREEEERRLQRAVTEDRIQTG